MDAIEFRVARSKHAKAGVSILINGVDLIKLVRKHELPMATADGSAEIAGGYAPNSRRWFHSEYKKLVGGAPEGPKLSLFCCSGCGDIGCWPLDVKVSIEGEQVIWSDFEQPHRRGKWEYTTFGPFHFDADQYATALSQAGLVPKG